MKRLSQKEKKRIKHLAKEGKSLYKIMKITGFRKTTIYYHVNEFLKKNARVDISNISDWERGYLIGLFFGDGNFYLEQKRGQYRVVFTLNAKSEEKIIDKTMEILRKTGGNPYTQKFENRMRITCISKPLYEFINNFISYKIAKKGIEKINKKDNIKNFKSWKKESMFGFVAGMIDSDGFIGADKAKYTRILISTYSHSFPKSFSKILSSLGMNSSIQKTEDRGYVVRLSTPSYEKQKNKINCVKGR